MSVRTIVFLTALECEYEAVRDHLKGVKFKLEDKSYAIGTYTSSQKVEWQVIVRRQSQGNYKAIQEVEWAIRRFEPNYLFFVGIAGGEDDDVKLGDVVVAEKVIGYESSREQETSSKGRPITKEPTEFLVELAKHIADENHWLKKVKGFNKREWNKKIKAVLIEHLKGEDWEKKTEEEKEKTVEKERCKLVEVQNHRPKAYVRPIASGEKTVASKEFSRKLELGAVAFEKEGFGFLEGLSSNKNQYGIVIRGISDLLEGKKKTDKQGWQRVAACHAAGFAFAMLDELPEFTQQDYEGAQKIVRKLDEQRWDIFVSYATIDDEPTLPGEKGWVTTFIEKLHEKLLNQRTFLKELPSFYPPKLIQTETELHRKFMEHIKSRALRDSRVMIVILSVTYSDTRLPPYSEYRNFLEGCRKIFVVQKGESPAYLADVRQCIRQEKGDLSPRYPVPERLPNEGASAEEQKEWDSILEKLANDIIEELKSSGHNGKQS